MAPGFRFSVILVEWKTRAIVVGTSDVFLSKSYAYSRIEIVFALSGRSESELVISAR
jgi:hypothetical protein